MRRSVRHRREPSRSPSATPIRSSMQTEDLGHMCRHQVRRREERLRERAIRISREVKRAQADGLPLPYISRDTGIDMSYEHEEWRRWASLAIEMKRADAEFVCDLGVERVGYWQAALNPEQRRAPPPFERLSARRTAGARSACGRTVSAAAAPGQQLASAAAARPRLPRTNRLLLSPGSDGRASACGRCGTWVLN